MVRINITIPEELLESLDLFAKDSGYNRSEYLRELVRRGILNQGMKIDPPVKKLDNIPANIEPKPSLSKQHQVVKPLINEELCEHGFKPTWCNKKGCKHYVSWR
jgi:hypothetical protein